jgi:hypothetical protein
MTGPFRQLKRVQNKKVMAALQRQRDGNSAVLGVLSAMGADLSKPLCVEFFFYAKVEDRAQALRSALDALGYKAWVSPPREKGEYCINGWTPPMPGDDVAFGAWSDAMVRLAERFEAQFDGWGTFDDQDDDFFDQIDAEDPEEGTATGPQE